MPKPSHESLLVFQAALRRMDRATLIALHTRFEALREHPAAIALIIERLAALNKTAPPSRRRSRKRR